MKPEEFIKQRFKEAGYNHPWRKYFEESPLKVLLLALVEWVIHKDK